MDIGFEPANDVWEDSQAQFGLFSFDSGVSDSNKYKRAFNNGCQYYSPAFEATFIKSDQTWHISRIMAYISGIASLVALSTAWLLTITPLPASFFWPGVLLPSTILAMLTGAAKFLFFDTQICSEKLWFMDDASEPVAAQSCDIGESSVFGIASVAAYFFCTILICFRSPQKRVLDENFGKRGGGGQGSTITHTGTEVICNDPEQGQQQQQAEIEASNPEHRESIQDSQRTMKVKNINNNSNNREDSEDDTPNVIEQNQHTRSTSDVTWSTDTNMQPIYNERSRNLGVLTPPTKKKPDVEEQRPGEDTTDVEWNPIGRPIVVTFNDSGQSTSRSLSYSDGGGSGTTGSSSSKSPNPRGTPSKKSLPPRHNGKSTIQQQSASKNSSVNNNSTHGSREYDGGSVHSRISKISFADTQASDEMSTLGMQSISVGSSAKSGAPSVVAIPRVTRTTRPHTFSGTSPGSHASSGKKRNRYGKHHRSSREDRNDVFLNEQLSTGSSNVKRDLVEYLPRLDEMSTTRSLDDHGDLISKCVRDLEQSFCEDNNGFGTL